MPIDVIRINFNGRYRRVCVCQPVGWWLSIVLRLRGYAQEGALNIWGKHSKVSVFRYRIDSAEYQRLTATYEYFKNPDFYRKRVWEIAP